MYSSPLFSIDGIEFKTPVLMVTPDEDYAAIFEYGDQVAVLRSQAGRCVLSYPVHQRGQADAQREQLKAQGFIEQQLPSNDFAGFIQRFMQVAGFTADKLMDTLARCSGNRPTQSM